MKRCGLQQGVFAVGGARFLAAVAAAFVLGGALGAARAEDAPDLAPFYEHLHAWDAVGAAALVPDLVARHAAQPSVRIALARLRLMERDFDGAARALDGLCPTATTPAAADVPASLRSLCDIVAGSRDVTRGFLAFTSPAGRFVLHVRPGPDEVLVPYMADVLDAAHRELGGVFGHFPTAPVHVDILPSVEDLARMTPLTEDEVKASGTIAMCKYGRIMVVSPRDLVYGYGWHDTVAHEYIHFLLTRRTANRVPLWLHEGLAKHFEQRWRGPSHEARLIPMMDHVLAEGRTQNRLIAFERLHPSIGKMPSQEEATLAYAQVATLVEWMLERRGVAGLDRLLTLLGEGLDEDAALRAVYDLPFRGMVREWRRYLGTRPFQTIPKAYRQRLLFRGSDRAEDELLTIEEERGRDHTYLGDLLRARQRPAAALRQYERAVAISGVTSPVIQSKKAAALLALGRFEDVLVAVEDVLKSYPTYVLLHLYRGEALLRLGKPGAARAALEEANGLNPFDPQLHGLLAEALEALGNSERAAFERRQQALITQD